MMNCWMIFRHVVSIVCWSCSPVGSELLSIFLHLSQWNLMSMAFFLFGCIVFFTTPKAVVLSIWIGVGG